MTGSQPPVFFDLDGTLTDSSAGIIGSLRHAIHRAGIPVPDDDLSWLIGPPIRNSLATLVGQDREAQVFAYYRERYDERGWRENEPYEGIHDLLGRITSRGIPAYVATAKPTVFAKRILEHFDLGRFFIDTFGSELDGTCTRKDELLRWARAGMNMDGPGVMVGDRRYDVEAAHANGLQAVGVTWGFGTRDELADAGAHAIVDAPATLGTVLATA